VEILLAELARRFPGCVAVINNAGRIARIRLRKIKNPSLRSGQWERELIGLTADLNNALREMVDCVTATIRRP
jgi:hypothetical protein